MIDRLVVRIVLESTWRQPQLTCDRTRRDNNIRVCIRSQRASRGWPLLLYVIVPPRFLSETPDASRGFQQMVVGRLPARMFPGSGPRYKSPQETEGQEDAEEQRVFQNALGQAALVLEKVAEAVTTFEAHSPIATADAGGGARGMSYSRQ